MLVKSILFAWLAGSIVPNRYFEKVPVLRPSFNTLCIVWNNSYIYENKITMMNLTVDIYTTLSSRYVYDSSKVFGLWSRLSLAFIVNGFSFVRNEHFAICSITYLSLPKMFLVGLYLSQMNNNIGKDILENKVEIL